MGKLRLEHGSSLSGSACLRLVHSQQFDHLHTEIHKFIILTLLPFFDPFTLTPGALGPQQHAQVPASSPRFPSPEHSCAPYSNPPARPPLSDTAGTQQATAKKHDAKRPGCGMLSLLLGRSPFSGTQTVPGTKFVPQRRDRHTAQREPQQFYIGCSVLTSSRQTGRHPTPPPLFCALFAF